MARPSHKPDKPPQGSRLPAGYIMLSIDGKPILEHRHIVQRLLGRPLVAFDGRRIRRPAALPAAGDWRGVGDEAGVDAGWGRLWLGRRADCLWENPKVARFRVAEACRGRGGFGHPRDAQLELYGVEFGDNATIAEANPREPISAVARFAPEPDGRRIIQ